MCECSLLVRRHSIVECASLSAEQGDFVVLFLGEVAQNSSTVARR